MSAEFAAWVTDALAPLGGVSARRMFGGVGIFRDGLMFALIADDRLHFKADASTSERYAAEGCGPFTYTARADRRTVMSYWAVPERLLDEPDELVDWAREAWAVALRAGQKKARGRRKDT